LRMMRFFSLTSTSGLRTVLNDTDWSVRNISRNTPPPSMSRPQAPLTLPAALHHGLFMLLARRLYWGDFASPQR
jgi:hypothetical protein